MQDLNDDMNRDAIHWSDPDPDDTSSTFKVSDRGAGFIFGKGALEEFLNNVGGKVMIRGHEAKPGMIWDGKLATVFSTGEGSEDSGYGGTGVEPIFVTIDGNSPIEQITPENIQKVDYSAAK